MRLWHLTLLPYLDKHRLLGQHRECCALRGKGWGRKHATVDYVFKHSPLFLIRYHEKVMYELERRGIKISPEWWSTSYRGKTLGFVNVAEWRRHAPQEIPPCDGNIYPEHDDAYLEECLENLMQKGVELRFRKAT